MRHTLRLSVALAVLALLAAGLAFGAGWPTYPKLTTTTPASGCRQLDGTVRACNPQSPWCTLVTLTTPLGTAPACDIDGQPRIDPYPPTGCPPKTSIDAGAYAFYPPGCEPVVSGFGGPSACPAVARAVVAAWSNLIASSTYATWAFTYLAESTKVRAWYVAGATTAPPATKTRFGAALVQLTLARAVTGC